jgi:carboxymethylenebutenolidase
MKLNIFFPLLALVLVAGCSQSIEQPDDLSIPELQEGETTDHMSVVGQTNQFLSIVGTNGNDIELISKDLAYFEEAQGYVVRPDDSMNYPGIILIHEWWGLNDHIKEVADTLAKEGYVVFTVDLYNGEVAQTRDQAMSLRTSIDNSVSVENMKAAIEYLKVEENVENVASLGFCFGGEQSALLSISDADLDATVIFYGSLPQELNQISKVDAPVLGIFGELDTGITPDTVEVFREGLINLELEHEITIYDGVGHAFLNPEGSRFAENQTKDAWNKTINFLEKNLK